MIIVKLWGGMCNQMFQYAFGYSIAKKNKDELLFDVDFYENQPLEHNNKRMAISNKQFPLLKLRTIERPSLIKIFENKYISHIIRYNSGCLLSFPKINLMIEKLHRYYPNISYKKDCVNYYDGYWQTSRYFDDYSQAIKEVFSPCEEILAKCNEWRSSLKTNCCVAIHIRRGDYLDMRNQRTLHEGNVIGDENYYRRAIEMMKSKLTNPVFCFFSDDIEWCKSTFGRQNDHIYVENKGQDAALIDLFSISFCNHGIMSPSTFSWWGNWLRKNRDSIVIAPKGEYSNEFFIDDNWIRI